MWSADEYLKMMAENDLFISFEKDTEINGRRHRDFLAMKTADNRHMGLHSPVQGYSAAPFLVMEGALKAMLLDCVVRQVGPDENGNSRFELTELGRQRAASLPSGMARLSLN